MPWLASRARIWPGNQAQKWVQTGNKTEAPWVPRAPKGYVWCPPVYSNVSKPIGVRPKGYPGPFRVILGHFGAFPAHIGSSRPVPDHPEE